MLPKRRTTDLHVEQIDKETVIYDTLTNEAHCLTPVAGHVWQEIDNFASIEELTDAVGRLVDVAVDEETIAAAMAALVEKNLLQAVNTTATQPGGMTRRQLNKSAVAAAGLAFVTTVMAPTAAQAASHSSAA